MQILVSTMAIIHHRKLLHFASAQLFSDDFVEQLSNVTGIGDEGKQDTSLQSFNSQSKLWHKNAGRGKQGRYFYSAAQYGHMCVCVFTSFTYYVKRTGLTLCISQLSIKVIRNWILSVNF